MRTVAKLIIGLGSYTHDAGCAIQTAGDRLMQLGMTLYEAERLHPMFSPNGELDESLADSAAEMHAEGPPLEATG